MDLPENIGSRVGLLGGTFDPVHNGHLAIAARAREYCRLDAVIFIPAANPPHKKEQAITALHHRQRMLELACHPNRHTYISSLEAERLGPSYTVDTLRTLKKHFVSPTKLFFIVGSDSFIDLPFWKEPRRLLDYASIVVAHRVCNNRGDIEKILALQFPSYSLHQEEKLYRSAEGGEAIILLDMEPVEVSATEIRERVRLGRPIDAMVPMAVADYIRREGLYKRDER